MLLRHSFIGHAEPCERKHGFKAGEGAGPPNAGVADAVDPGVRGSATRMPIRSLLAESPLNNC